MVTETDYLYYFDTGPGLQNKLLKERLREEVTGRLGRRRKQVLDDLEEAGGYCKLKEETLNPLSGELAMDLS
jgi:hypothetical protein